MKRGQFRILLIVFLLALVTYIGIFPMFWPKPKVKVDCPPTLHIGEDLHLTVRVSAWHPLLHVHRIRFTPDNERSSALRADESLFPLQPYGVSPKRFGDGDFFRRVTWPVTRERKTPIFLGERDVLEKLQPGKLFGTIDVEFTHARYTQRMILTNHGSEKISVIVDVLSAEDDL